MRRSPKPSAEAKSPVQIRPRWHLAERKVLSALPSTACPGWPLRARSVSFLCLCRPDVPIPLFYLFTLAVCSRIVCPAIFRKAVFEQVPLILPTTFSTNISANPFHTSRRLSRGSRFNSTVPTLRKQLPTSTFQYRSAEAVLLITSSSRRRQKAPLTILQSRPSTHGHLSHLRHC
ncbi:hypothetical protein P280DRAFT_112363 [Massarina eburnea CBS 473.64]|uniref:Uncharacterized protein n=1 Tax=Massarina eburnea CBS 473.64 TaxID=1395130 RepID=A0A6A6RSI5_9PLEO|nr:hypothetical protein P280DRAFT_112363 [Massarina eburnea CBS 473.64]